MHSLRHEQAVGQRGRSMSELANWCRRCGHVFDYTCVCPTKGEPLLPLVTRSELERNPPIHTTRSPAQSAASPERTHDEQDPDH